MNLIQTLQNLFAVADSKTNKIVEEGFKDKKSAKVKRNELNKPFKEKERRLHESELRRLPRRDQCGLALGLSSGLARTNIQNQCRLALGRSSGLARTNRQT